MMPVYAMKSTQWCLSTHALYSQHQCYMGCHTAGVTDHLAESEPHAISIARNILGNINMAAAGAKAALSSLPDPASTAAGSLHGVQQHSNVDSMPGASWEEPLFPAEELRGPAK